MVKIETTSEAGKHRGEINCIVYDHEHNHLYSGGEDGVITVWDKDLKFLREIPIHKDYPVWSLVMNDHSQLYSCGRDGSLRYFRRPWSHDHNDIMLQTVMDDVLSLYCVDNVMFSGDDKGIVTKWYHNQVGCQYNVLEEVKSMAVEDHYLYTVRDSDVVITDIMSGFQGYTTVGTVEGRAPLILLGPVENKHAKYLACATRDGKGIHLYHNAKPFKKFWTKENAHQMIINAIIGTDDTLFTAGFDGKVKKWTNLENGPKLAEEIDVGKCVNTLCFGPDNTIFAGDASGLIKRLQFSK